MVIKRLGPPQAIDANHEHLRLKVMISDSPDRTWVHFFQQYPSEFTSTAHPKLVEFDGQTLAFTARELEATTWIRLIDIWISDANKHYQRHLATLRQEGQQRQEAEQDRQRKISEANERLKKLL